MIEALTTDPGTLIATFGLLGVLAVVFIESGLLLGFFLPGDSLLFTAGVFAAQPHAGVPLWLLMLTVPVAAAAGDQCGFAIGAQAGPAVFDRANAKRLGRKHIARARDFYASHGAAAVMLARFVPVVRTLAPVLAGASGMSRRVFAGYNVLGALAWGAGVPLIGYLLGGIGVVRGHIDAILLGIVAVSIAPLLLGFLRARLRRPIAQVGPVRRRVVAEPALLTGR